MKRALSGTKPFENPFRRDVIIIAEAIFQVKQRFVKKSQPKLVD